MFQWSYSEKRLAGNPIYITDTISFTRYGIFLKLLQREVIRSLNKLIVSDKAIAYTIPANIYLFKVNNRNIRKRYEKCSKLTIKTPKQRQWRRSGAFTVNFEHISHLFLMFLLLIWTSKC